MGVNIGERIRASLHGFRGGMRAFVIDDSPSYSTQADNQTYTGNVYKTYSKIISAISKKYQAKDDWGCQQVGNIVDVRSAFIVGEGLDVSLVKPEEKSSPEMDFIHAFLAFNSLDKEAPQEFAKEAEIEGCFLGALQWDEKGKMVSLRFRSRVESNYKVITPKGDYSKYERIKFDDPGIQSLEEPEFVYARFGGRIHLPNEPTPKIGKVLTEIEGLSKALRDWRENNNLFAAPIPYIRCENSDQAKWMAANLGTAVKNWKLRKLFVLTGEPGYLVPGENTQLEKEIVTLAKIISGATGVPVHFLGLPDLMSNRATAENLMELVAASTRKERLIWIGTYQQIIAKAMAIWNKESIKTILDPKKVVVSIPYVSEATWQRIQSIYLPLYQEDSLTKKTLLAQVPGLDVEAEMKALEEREKTAFESAKSRPVDGDEEDEEDADGSEDE